MPYTFLPDIATADVAFRAWGATLEEAFIDAAEATMQVMVEDLKAIAPRQERRLTVSAPTHADLLFKLLQELIYYKDAEQLVLRVTELQIEDFGPLVSMSARLRGELLDPSRHKLGTDVKAVTMHLFDLKAVDSGWEATVVLDI